jgi:hypothetical protein
MDKASQYIILILLVMLAIEVYEAFIKGPK